MDWDSRIKTSKKWSMLKVIDSMKIIIDTGKYDLHLFWKNRRRAWGCISTSKKINLVGSTVVIEESKTNNWLTRVICHFSKDTNQDLIWLIKPVQNPELSWWTQNFKLTQLTQDCSLTWWTQNCSLNRWTHKYNFWFKRCYHDVIFDWGENHDLTHWSQNTHLNSWNIH